MRETFINVWHYEQWHTQNGVRPYATLTFQGWLVPLRSVLVGGRRFWWVLVFGRDCRIDLPECSGDPVWLVLRGFWCILITALLLLLCAAHWRGRGSHISSSASSAELSFAKAHRLLESRIIVVRHSNGCSIFERWTTQCGWEVF